MYSKMSATEFRSAPSAPLYHDARLSRPAKGRAMPLRELITSYHMPRAGGGGGVRVGASIPKWPLLCCGVLGARGLGYDIGYQTTSPFRGARRYPMPL